MLGRRNPQRSLFEAPTWPHPVASDSFYARLASVNDLLFRDEDLSEMYCLDNGRPSLLPSLLSGATLLQFYDNVSDEEAVERTRFDLRWKVALHLPLDFPGFDPSCLSYFRKRLVEHQKERYRNGVASPPRRSGCWRRTSTTIARPRSIGPIPSNAQRN